MAMFNMVEVEKSNIPLVGRGKGKTTSYVDNLIDYFKGSLIESAEIKGGPNGDFMSLQEMKSFASSLQNHIKQRGIKDVRAMVRGSRLFIVREEEN